MTLEKDRRINTLQKSEGHFKKGALLLGVIFLLLGAWNSTFNNVSGGTACFSAGILVILLFHFDVKKFNIFGMAAELREKLDEADKILEQLRGISLPVSEIAINVASKTGRTPERISRQALFNYVKDIEGELLALNVSQRDIDRVKKGWYSITSIEMATLIYREINKKLDSKKETFECERVALSNKEGCTSENYQQIMLKQGFTADDLSEIQRDIVSMHYNKPFAFEQTSLFLRKRLMGLSSLTDAEKNDLVIQLSEEWADLDYLLTHKTLRRPQVWFSE
ncbi:hypothetical protein [Pantoea agglomerans]